MKYIAYFEKYKFNKDKNELDYDLVPYTFNIRYKDYKPRREQFWISLLRYFIGATLILGFALLCGFTSDKPDSDKIGIILGIIFFSSLFILGLLNSIFGWSFEFEDNEEKENYFRDYYPEEYKELLEHNQKVFEETETWRANHPFEEKVRIAMESKNSNDIAEVIRMILDKDMSEV